MPDYLNFDVNSSTLFIAWSLLSDLLRVPSIIDASSIISASFIPFVVTAGVPILKPLVTNGLSGSKGIVFLLVVI